MTATDINNALYRPVRSGNLYAAYMPPSDCSSKKLGNGDTSFAIQNMAKTAQKYKHHTRALTLKFFSGGNLSSLCNSLHQFLYWHFQYAIDGEAQLLRSPACSWASRFSGIDCKSYTIFASTVLLNAGITHYMRRIKQEANPNGYTHVYIVVPKNQQTASLSSGYYVIDGTINTTQELPYLAKDDVLMTAQNTKNQKAQINALAAPATLESQMQELLAQSYEISKQNAHTTGNVHKNQTINKINAVGSAASATAAAITALGTKAAIVSNAVPGIGTIVGLCIAAVTAVVALAVLFFGNPCAGAFYTSDTIDKALKEQFYEQFKNTLESVRQKFAQGLEPVAISELNLLLKEIDLGVAHYRHECQVHVQKCSAESLLSYQSFVSNVQQAVNTMLQMLQFKLSEHFSVTVEEKRTTTANRSWYFIVPAAKEPIFATYRALKVEQRTQRKGAYPYNTPLSFQQWLQANATRIQIDYGITKANDYKAEMQPFESKILAIRRNVFLPVVTQFTLEEELQRQQESIYIKYDLAYQQALKNEEKARLEAYINSNQAFWQTLTKLHTSRQLDEKGNYDNQHKIANYEAKQQLNIENKKIINLLLIGSLGILLIKMMNNNK
ncbi:hypothetical protein [Capnocytophaga sp. oral taxon 878]|uniref:hypothetical protein n=1 Tax=Capnocytophaga sp. oral taxon 878 TaxID=1316596 RepID=UPI000D04248E|nr:hypothetical protein [Capnocytophaga sp. oral taxon 878]AVM49321.1 hypothetical protein C4H12_01880 [Capnocytophaga sp. oral taxon 878]